MAADWSELPSELLQLISEKLNNSELYLIRFRSVCSSWRRSSSIPNHKLLKLPPFSNDSSEYYLVKHNIFLIKSPTTPIPWLIRIGPDFIGRTRLWHPLNIHERLPFCFPHNTLLDFNQLSVLDVGHVFYILQDNDPFPKKVLATTPYRRVYPKKVVATTCPGEQPLIVTFNDHWEPWMFRSGGDDGWMKIRNVSKCSFGDICNFNGRPFVIDDIGQTVMVGTDITVHSVAETFSGKNSRSRFCLVENENELLLVNRNYVFKLDEKEKKWVKSTNIGDKVLFVGDGCSFSVSASDLGFANGNCVITMDFSMKSGMRIFHLDQGRVSPLSDYPDYLKLFSRRPEWMKKRTR